jgi:hypothetical protein
VKRVRNLVVFKVECVVETFLAQGVCLALLADGKSGAQLNVARLAVLVSVLIILCSLGICPGPGFGCQRQRPFCNNDS